MAKPITTANVSTDDAPHTTRTEIEAAAKRWRIEREARDLGRGNNGNAQSEPTKDILGYEIEELDILIGELHAYVETAEHTFDTLRYHTPFEVDLAKLASVHLATIGKLTAQIKDAHFHAGETAHKLLGGK